MLAGILASSTNTGVDDEIQVFFSAPVSLKSNIQILTGDAITLRRIRVISDNQRWEITANSIQTNGSADALIASVEKSTEAQIYIRMPQVYNITPVGADTTAAAAAARANTVNFAVKVPKGNFVRFGNHSKVYLVTADSPTGAASKIFPPLKAALTASVAVYTDNRVTLTAMYDKDHVGGITFTDGVLADPGSSTYIEKI